MRIGGGGFGGIEDAVWATTGDLDSETRSLEVAVAALGHDIAAAPTTDWTQQEAFQRAWNAFVEDFSAWAAAGWFWNPTRRDQLLVYRQRFNTLRAQFLAQPGALTVVPEAAGAQRQPDALDKAGNVITKVAIVVGVGVAVWIGATVYREISAARKVAGGGRRATG